MSDAIDPQRIALVPQMGWNNADNSAEELVTELMGYLKEKSQESFDELQDALDDLGDEIASASMPTTDVDYSHVDGQLTMEDVTSLRPGFPTFPNTDGVTKPQKPDITEVQIPDFPTIPEFTEESPTDTFNYDESPYTSDILTQLKTSIYGWLSDGGVEMDSLISAAITAAWDAARSRLTDEWRIAQTNAMGFYPSRRWSLHVGAQNHILRQVNGDFQKRLDELNDTLTSKEAELKIQNRQFIITTSKEFELTLMDLADKTASRLFEAAKTAFTMIYEAYEMRVKAYVAHMQGITAEIDAKDKVADVQIRINEGRADIFTAEMTGYKVEIDAILGVIDGEARLYAAKVTGYDAEIKRAKANLDAQLEKLKALIQQSTDLTNLQVKEAEVDLQAYVNSLGLSIEASKAVASILGQIAASSLGALNTHATMSDGVSRSFGSSYSHSESLSNTKTHSFTEEAATEEDS